MIKLYDCVRKTDVYIKKSVITGMIRKENTTDISSEDFPFLIVVNETPEEILAMPDIETKVIDWEQRRFDLISALFVKYGCSPDNLPYFLGDIIPRVDALINELKKGQDNEN